MKKSIYLFSAVLVGILFTVLISCTEDPKETCEQDEICTDKEVIACCTDNDCVWKFNGKEYTLDQEDQLAIDLGCSISGKSTDNEDDHSYLISRLRDLMEKAQVQN